MSNAHTPGPWTVSRGGWDDNAHACYSLEGVKDVRVADARLIAAAPELLECLILLTQKGIKQSTGLGWNQRVRMAQAIIAKATGGSNA